MNLLQVIICGILALLTAWAIALGITVYARWRMKRDIEQTPPHEIRDISYQEWVDTLKEQEFTI